MAIRIEHRFLENIFDNKIPQDFFAKESQAKQSYTSTLEADIDISGTIKKLAVSNVPTLAKPNTALPTTENEGDVGKKKTHNEKYNLLLGDLVKLINKNAESTILNNLNTAIALNEAKVKNYNSVAAEYDALLNKSEELKIELEACSDKYHNAVNEKSQAQAELSSLILERQSYILYSEKYNLLSAQIRQQQTVVEEKTVVESERKQEYDTKKKEIVSVLKQVENKLGVLRVAYDQLTPMQAVVYEGTKNNALSKFVELITEFLNLIGKDNEDIIESQHKLNEFLHNKRIEKLNKQAEEIEKKSKTSGILKKIIGVFGLLIGAVLAVVGVLTSVPSLGSGSVLASLGFFIAITSLSLFFIDFVYEVSTGFEKSFTGMLFEELNKIIKELLDSVLGKEKDNTNSALATVISTAIYFSLMAALSGTASIAKTATIIENKVIEFAMKLSSFATLLQTIGTPAFNISISVFEKQISDYIAKMTLIQNDIRHVNQLKDEMIKTFDTISKQRLDLANTVLNVLDDRKRAINYSYNEIRNSGLSA
ncbi:YopB/SseC family type III secretion system translocon subunit [Salmonella enterica]|nr:YopB/SseC family type III secretion system translocon subunit [Salmonella enterica]EHG4041547.1 YopB/SseC family type III secretion system translocon subunit [Salmonella enterica]